MAGPAQRGLPPCLDKGGTNRRSLSTLLFAVQSGASSTPSPTQACVIDRDPQTLNLPSTPSIAQLSSRCQTASLRPPNSLHHLAIRSRSGQPRGSFTRTHFALRPAVKPRPAKALARKLLHLPAIDQPFSTLQPLHVGTVFAISPLIIVFCHLLPPSIHQPAFALGQTPQHPISNATNIPPWSLHNARDHSHQILRRLFKLAVTTLPIHRTLVFSVLARAPAQAVQRGPTP